MVSDKRPHDFSNKRDQDNDRDKFDPPHYDPNQRVIMYCPQEKIWQIPPNISDDPIHMTSNPSTFGYPQGTEAEDPAPENVVCPTVCQNRNIFELTLTLKVEETTKLVLRVSQLAVVASKGEWPEDEIVIEVPSGTTLNDNLLQIKSPSHHLGKGVAANICGIPSVFRDLCGQKQIFPEKRVQVGPARNNRRIQKQKKPDQGQRSCKCVPINAVDWSVREFVWHIFGQTLLNPDSGFCEVEVPPSKLENRLLKFKLKEFTELQKSIPRSNRKKINLKEASFRHSKVSFWIEEFFKTEFECQLEISKWLMYNRTITKKMNDVVGRGPEGSATKQKQKAAHLANSEFITSKFNERDGLGCFMTESDFRKIVLGIASLTYMDPKASFYLNFQLSGNMDTVWGFTTFRYLILSMQSEHRKDESKIKKGINLAVEKDSGLKPMIVEVQEVNRRRDANQPRGNPPREEIAYTMKTLQKLSEEDEIRRRMVKALTEINENDFVDMLIKNVHSCSMGLVNSFKDRKGGSEWTSRVEQSGNIKINKSSFWGDIVKIPDRFCSKFVEDVLQEELKKLETDKGKDQDSEKDRTAKSVWGISRVKDALRFCLQNVHPDPDLLEPKVQKKMDLKHFLKLALESGILTKDLHLSFSTELKERV